LAVWLCMSARSVTDKILAILFPITAFVASGFEHCVANMYFIPAGIFAKGFQAAQASAGLGAAQLTTLNWTTMWTQNLVSVTLGNIVGGAVFVGVAYFLANLCGREAVRPAPEMAQPRVRPALAPERAALEPLAAEPQPVQARTAEAMSQR